jgi:NitT/TauT family transport system substrate-binding protein
MSHDHSNHAGFGLIASGLFVRRSLLKIGAAAAGAAAVTGFGELPASAATWSEKLGTLKIGYLPITDASPLLIAHGKDYFGAKGVTVAKPTLFRSWPSIAEAFAAKQVDVVHLLMPLALQLKFQAKQDIKVIAWNHTDGSALTVAKSINAVGDLAGKTVAIPFWYSIHNVILQQILRKNGLKAITSGDASASKKEVKLVVLAPADMPAALASGKVSGFIVAEPFNALAEVNGIGKVLRFSGDVWRDHACCVTVIRGDLIKNNPEAAQAVVDSIAKAQLWLNSNRSSAGSYLGAYLPQAPAAITKAINDYGTAYNGTAIQHPEWKNDRIGFQPFPYPSYTSELVKQLGLTTVDGDSSWLKKINLKTVHNDLVNSALVESSIKRLGGISKFGKFTITRKETIAP